MRYHFRPLHELGWAVAIAVAMVILPAFVNLEPEKITDWRVWAVAIAAASIRAAAGAALDYVLRSVPQDPDPTLADQILALSPAERQALVKQLEAEAKVEWEAAHPLISKPPRFLDRAR